jgi:hypothetical protein
MINQDMCNFHNALAVYAEYGGVAFAAEEGQNIAKAMGKNSKVRYTLRFSHFTKKMYPFTVESQSEISICSQLQFNRAPSS